MYMPSGHGDRSRRQNNNDVDENQNCHILTDLFNRINWLWVPKYNLYSSTLFYTKCFYIVPGVWEIPSEEVESKWLKGFPLHKRARVHNNFKVDI